MLRADKNYSSHSIRLTAEERGALDEACRILSVDCGTSVPLSFFLCTAGFSEAVRAGFCPLTHERLREKAAPGAWQRAVEARGVKDERASLTLVPLMEPLVLRAAAWAGIGVTDWLLCSGMLFVARAAELRRRSPMRAIHIPEGFAPLLAAAGARP